MNKVGKNKGFTIIEVVLVLAIAGLIFLIVFLAVPALQRSRRDTQRKSDVSRLLAQLEQYAGNNNGNYPTLTQVQSGGTFYTSYLTADGDSFSDPSTGSYSFQAVKVSQLGQIQYSTNAKCATGETLQVNTGGATRNRDVAAVIKTENGIGYCQDNR